MTTREEQLRTVAAAFCEDAQGAGIDKCGSDCRCWTDAKIALDALPAPEPMEQALDVPALARRCACGIRGCATDEQYVELLDRIEDAIRFARALPLQAPEPTEGQRARIDEIAREVTAEAKREIEAADALGKWMSAALDDPTVCAEMKADITRWFEAGQPVPHAMPLQDHAKRWRHKKRGSTYTEIARGQLQTAAETSIGDYEDIVVYRGDDGRVWVRPVVEFDDGRFELIPAVLAEHQTEAKS